VVCGLRGLCDASSWNLEDFSSTLSPNIQLLFFCHLSLSYDCLCDPQGERGSCGYDIQLHFPFRYSDAATGGILSQ